MFDKDSWNTPEEVLERVRKIAPIGFDPCSNQTSTVNAKVSYGIEANGLVTDWYDRGMVFCNPPYSRGNLLKWAAKIHAEAKAGTEIVFVVPANVQTAAWQKHLWRCNAVCFPDHRIAFLRDGVAVKSPPMVTVVGYFGHRKMKFFEAFNDYGKVVFP